MVKELKEYRHWVWNCFRDSTCKHVFSWHLKSAAYDDVCPPLARYGFDCYAAQGKMGELARTILEGELEWSPKLLEVIYKDSNDRKAGWVWSPGDEKPDTLVNDVPLNVVV